MSTPAPMNDSPSVAAQRILLKTDAQGYDMAAIRSAGAWLDRVVAIQTELAFVATYEGQSTYLDDVREIEALGFRMTGIIPVTRNAALHIVDADVVFRRA